MHQSKTNSEVNWKALQLPSSSKCDLFQSNLSQTLQRCSSLGSASTIFGQANSVSQSCYSSQPSSAQSLLVGVCQPQTNNGSFSVVRLPSPEAMPVRACQSCSVTARLTSGFATPDQAPWQPPETNQLPSPLSMPTSSQIFSLVQVPSKELSQQQTIAVLNPHSSHPDRELQRQHQQQRQQQCVPNSALSGSRKTKHWMLGSSSTPHPSNLGSVYWMLDDVHPPAIKSSPYWMVNG